MPCRLLIAPHECPPRRFGGQLTISLEFFPGLFVAAECRSELLLRKGGRFRHRCPTADSCGGKTAFQKFRGERGGIFQVPFVAEGGGDDFVGVAGGR